LKEIFERSFERSFEIEESPGRMLIFRRSPAALFYLIHKAISEIPMVY